MVCAEIGSKFQPEVREWVAAGWPCMNVSGQSFLIASLAAVESLQDAGPSESV